MLFSKIFSSAWSVIRSVNTGYAVSVKYYLLNTTRTEHPNKYVHTKSGTCIHVNKYPANVGSMLGQRRRRWPNIEPALAEHPMFAGICMAIMVMPTTLSLMSLHILHKHRP